VRSPLAVVALVAASLLAPAAALAQAADDGARRGLPWAWAWILAAIAVVAALVLLVVGRGRPGGRRAER
jgi:hypothetical protein